MHHAGIAEVERGLRYQVDRRAYALPVEVGGLGLDHLRPVEELAPHDIERQRPRVAVRIAQLEPVDRVSPPRVPGGLGNLRDPRARPPKERVTAQ